MAKSRPASKGESKNTLIIILVLFVLISIGAIVWGYFGYDGQGALIAERDKLKKEAVAEKKEQDWQRLQALFYKINAGYAKDTDVTDFAELVGRYDKAPAALIGEGQRAQAEKTDFDDKRDLFRKRLGEDPVKAKATFKDQVEKLTQERDQAVKAKEDAQKAQATAVADAQTAKQDLDKARKDFEARVAALQGDLDKVRAAKSEEFRKLMAMNEEYQKTSVDVKDTGSKKEKEFKDQVAGLQKTIGEMDNKIKKLEERLASTVKMEDLEQPKGSIVTVDRTGNTIYIDLGSADRVREGLTFSIAGRGANGKGQGKIKGSLEVVSIVGPHLAKARITDVADPNRDPILNGDLLFNLAWNPSMRERVAIAGLIDLDGDGVDDTHEFIKQLQKMNIDVDAWLDLKDLKVKGSGMSLQTSYLILGPTPEIDATMAARDGDARTARRGEIISKMSEIQNEADRMGIEKISIKRFLAKIGYRLPRGATSTTLPNYDSRGGVNIGAPSPESKEDKEAPKGKDK